VSALDEPLAKLISLRHRDPHSLLGAHPDGTGLVVRAFRPDAERIELLPDAGGRIDHGRRMYLRRSVRARRVRLRVGEEDLRGPRERQVGVVHAHRGDRRPDGRIGRHDHRRRPALGQRRDVLSVGQKRDVAGARLLHLDAAQPENAADEYREAIRLKPDYSAGHRGLGRALERAGWIAEATGAYQQGLEVATRTGDLQTGKEIEVFLRRLEKAAG
jgi:tetratricopeptide (TPR) repeat protein